MKATHSRTIKVVSLDPRAAPAGRPLAPRFKALLSPAQAARNPWLRCNHRGDPHFYLWPGEDEYGEPTGGAGVAVVRDGAVVELDHAVELAGSYALSPDGTSVLFLNAEERDGKKRMIVDEVAVATGQTTHLVDLDPEEHGAHGWPGNILWLDDTSYAYDDAGVIFAFRLGEPAPFATLRVEGKLEHVALGGKLLVTGGKSPNKTRLLAVREDSLELLKNLKQDPPRYLYERDGRVVLDFTPGRVELHGVLEAVGEPGELPPPRAVAADDDPLGFVPRDPREVQETMHPEEGAFGRLELADGRSLVFREVEEGTFSGAIRDGDDEHEVDGKLWYRGASRPLFALAPDETSVLFLQGVAVWKLDLGTREHVKLGDLPKYRRYITHLGDAVLATGGKAHLSSLGDWSLADVDLGKVDNVAAFQGGRVILACRENGNNGPPESDVFVRDGTSFEKVGTLPIGVHDGWTVGGHDYVACWHGHAVYELPHLGRLLE